MATYNLRSTSKVSEKSPLVTGRTKKVSEKLPLSTDQTMILQPNIRFQSVAHLMADYLSKTNTISLINYHISLEEFSELSDDIANKFNNKIMCHKLNSGIKLDIVDRESIDIVIHKKDSSTFYIINLPTDTYLSLHMPFCKEPFVHFIDKETFMYRTNNI